jgi:hypothetical protein
VCTPQILSRLQIVLRDSTCKRMILRWSTCQLGSSTNSWHCTWSGQLRCHTFPQDTGYTETCQWNYHSGHQDSSNRTMRRCWRTFREDSNTNSFLRRSSLQIPSRTFLPDTGCSLTCQWNRHSGPQDTCYTPMRRCQRTVPSGNSCTPTAKLHPILC